MSDEPIVPKDDPIHRLIRDAERMTKVETNVHDIKSDLKYLYSDLKGHMAEDKMELKTIQEQLASHNVMLTELAKETLSLTRSVESLTYSYQKFLKFMYISIGIFSSSMTLIGVVWAVIRFIVPLIIK